MYVKLINLGILLFSIIHTSTSQEFDCKVQDVCALDIAMVIDKSGSIVDPLDGGRPENWLILKSFLYRLMEDTKFGTDPVQFAAIFFANNANPKAELNTCSNIQCMRDIIEAVGGPSGRTNTNGALRMTLARTFTPENGDRPDADNVILLLTDGKPVPYTPDVVRQTANEIKNKGIRIVGVGVGNEVDHDLMRDIVSSPSSQNYFQIRDFDLIVEQIEQIVQRACTVCTLIEATPAPPPLNLTLPSPWPCLESQDIALLLDLSGSIADVDPRGFDNLIEFARRIIPGIIQGNHRLGVATFSNDANLVINLDSCTTAACYNSAITGIQYEAGFTNLNAGLEVVETQIFGTNADRQSANNILVVVTDGFPNQELIQMRLTAQRLRGISRVMILAITKAADSEEIYQVASQPYHRNVILAPDFASMRWASFLQQFSELICEGPLPVLPSFGFNDDCALDIGLLVDMSGSIIDTDGDGIIDNYNNWWLLRNFLRKFVTEVQGRRNIRGEVRLAFEWFRTRPHVEWDLSGRPCNGPTDLDCFTKIINGINDPTGQTRMSTAFVEMRDKIWNTRSNRDSEGDVLILMTDGIPTKGYEPYRIARELREKYAVKILGVGITQDVSEDMMRRVVSPPFNDNYFPVPSFNALVDNLNKILSGVCKKKNETECIRRGDLMFILDSSSSMTSDEFDIMKRFVRDVTNSLPVSDDQVRVGLIQFATNIYTRTQVHLNELNSNVGIWRALERLQWRGGDTGTEKVLDHVADNMFTPERGDRADKANICIIFTDGDAQEKAKTLTAARKLKAKAHVITVKIGTMFDDNLLRGMTSDPWQKNLVEARNFNSFVNNTLLKGILLERICNQTNCTDELQCKNGGTLREVNGKCICECPEGTGGIDCGKNCTDQMDICFVVDTSLSISKEDFALQIAFLKNFTQNLGNLEKSRVCLISWSTTSTIHFRPGDFTDKTAALNAMDVHHEKKDTHTWLALNNTELAFRRTRRIDPVSGKQIPQVAIVFTDGGSQNPRRTADAASALRNSGDVTVVAIRLGNPSKRDREELESIGQKVFTLDGYDKLKEFLDPLVDLLCDPCDLSKKVCLNGGTPVRRNLECVCDCPPGTSGPNCEKDCSDLIDIVVLIDASGSIRGERFPFVINFLASVLKQIKVGPNNARIGAVMWSNTARTEFYLDTYISNQDVITAVRRIKFQGQRTNIYSALRETRTRLFGRRGDRPNAPNFVLMFTDGGANIETGRTPAEAAALKRDGVHVVVTAVGDDMNAKMLRSIASYPFDQNIFTTFSQSGLLAMVNRTANSFCDDVKECDSNPCLNDGTCIEDLNIYWCRCRRGFNGRNCQHRCDRDKDVTMVLDFSGSVSHVYDMVLIFAKKAVEMFNIDAGFIRVGVVAYSDFANVQYTLDDYRTKKGAVNAIRVERMQGTTNTQAGIRSAQFSVFGRRGDRPSAENVMVVVTDGHSNVSPWNTIPEAARAKARRTRIVVVGIGETNMAEITAIASPPASNNIVILNSEDEMDPALERLNDIVCS